MSVRVVKLKEKFESFTDFWNPKIVGELNGQQVKLAKFKGEFIAHRHENEDEMFLVIAGTLLMEIDNKTLKINAGEFVIIPKGIMHKPIADDEVHVMLFEPASTLNTGNMKNRLTVNNLDSI